MFELFALINIGQSFELIIMQFIARVSESSGLRGYRLAFLIFAQGLQKTLTNWPKLAATAAAPEFLLNIIQEIDNHCYFLYIIRLYNVFI